MAATVASPSRFFVWRFLAVAPPQAVPRQAAPSQNSVDLPAVGHYARRVQHQLDRGSRRRGDARCVRRGHRCGPASHLGHRYRSPQAGSIPEADPVESLTHAHHRSGNAGAEGSPRHRRPQSAFRRIRDRRRPRRHQGMEKPKAAERSWHEDQRHDARAHFGNHHDRVLGHRLVDGDRCRPRAAELADPISRS